MPLVDKRLEQPKFATKEDEDDVLRPPVELLLLVKVWELLDLAANKCPLACFSMGCASMSFLNLTEWTFRAIIRGALLNWFTYALARISPALIKCAKLGRGAQRHEKNLI